MNVVEFASKYGISVKRFCKYCRGKAILSNLVESGNRALVSYRCVDCGKLISYEYLLS